jgi:hypothetical protein
VFRCSAATQGPQSASVANAIAVCRFIGQPPKIFVLLEFPADARERES